MYCCFKSSCDCSLFVALSVQSVFPRVFTKTLENRPLLFLFCVVIIIFTHDGISGQENGFREHIRSFSLHFLPLHFHLLCVRVEIFGLAIRHRDNARGFVLQFRGENTDRDGVVRGATDLLGR